MCLSVLETEKRGIEERNKYRNKDREGKICNNANDAVGIAECSQSFRVPADGLYGGIPEDAQIGALQD